MRKRVRNPRLSRYFTLARLVASDTARARGIDNMPPAALLPNLRLLARGLDRVRLLLGHPLEISSVDYGFDDLDLDRIIGVTHPGNKASQRVLIKAGMTDVGWGRYYDRRLRLFAAENPYR